MGPGWRSGWAHLRGEMEIYDSLREDALKQARKMQRSAKLAIFALHRGDTESAVALLYEAQGHFGDFASKAEKGVAEVTGEDGEDRGELKSQCSELRRAVWGSAMEEFVEAFLFLHFLGHGNLPGFTSLKSRLELFSMRVREGGLQCRESESESVLRFEHFSTSVHKSEYLGALLDFCGEMNRWAVQQACARDKEAVLKCRDLALQIQAEFLQLDLRNGGLRRKYDALKYTVRNLERVLYDLTLSPSPEGALGAGGDLAPGGGEAPSTEQNAFELRGPLPGAGGGGPRGFD